jgi:hypothetical protein
LQDLYLDKKNLKVIEQYTKTNFLSRKEELKTINEDENDTFEDVNEKSSDIQKKSLVRSKTIGIKNNFNFFNRQRQATITSRQSQALSGVFARKGTISSKMRTTIEDSSLGEVIKSTKEVLDLFEENQKASKKIVDDNIKQQMIKFRERFRSKKMIHLRTESVYNK